MTCSDKPDTALETALNCEGTNAGANAGAKTGANAVLAREAGVPFRPPLGNAAAIDPIAEWVSLMEVVQMLCPVWPVRDRPMQGEHWKI